MLTKPCQAAAPTVSNLYDDVSNFEIICKKKALLLVNINIRFKQNQNNFEPFQELLQNFNRLPDILCISETRIKRDLITTNILLLSHDFIHQDSPTNAGGKVMYINNLIQYEQNQ